MHGHLKAQPDKGGALVALLLEAADALAENDQCHLYVVSRSLEDPDAVWVTEAWASREAHDGSLRDARIRALIERAMPLIDGSPEGMEVRYEGGKGVPRAPR